MENPDEFHFNSGIFYIELLILDGFHEKLQVDLWKIRVEINRNPDGLHACPDFLRNPPRLQLGFLVWIS